MGSWRFFYGPNKDYSILGLRMDSSELPDFIRKAEAVPRWVPLLFESIWLDSGKTREEKLKCLEEASLCWPPSINVEFHKWKFQFKEDKGAEVTFTILVLYATAFAIHDFS